PLLTAAWIMVPSLVFTRTRSKPAISSGPAGAAGAGRASCAWAACLSDCASVAPATSVDAVRSTRRRSGESKGSSAEHGSCAARRSSGRSAFLPKRRSSVMCSPRCGNSACGRRLGGLLFLEAFEKRNRLGLADGRMRREEYARGPVERGAALLVGHVEPRAVRGEVLDH